MPPHALAERDHGATEGAGEGEAKGNGEKDALGAYEGKAPPEEPTAYTLPKLVDLQPVRGSPERGRNETLDSSAP